MLTRLIPPLIPFSVINNILMSVNSSNPAFAYFNASCYGNLGAENKDQQDRADIFHKPTSKAVR